MTKREMMPIGCVSMAAGLAQAITSTVLNDPSSAAARATLATASTLLVRHGHAEQLKQAHKEAFRQRELLRQRASVLTTSGSHSDPLIEIASLRDRALTTEQARERRNILRALAQIQSDLLAAINALEPGLGHATTQMACPSAAEIRTALAAHWGASDLKVDDVRLVPGGTSKQTLTFTLTRGSGAAEALVIRKEGAHKAHASTLPLEFALLQLLQSCETLVPEVLLYEPNPAPLGGGFLVMRRAAGRNHGTAVAVTEPIPAAAARDVASTLGHLHGLSLDRIADLVDVNVDLRVQLRSRIDAAEAEWRRDRSVQAPLLEILFAWCRANIPAQLSAPCLVHGDVGFHNILIDAGRATALLDWERSRIGDPMEELSYVRPFIEGALDWDEFVREYQDAGGAPYLGANIKYYEVWRGVWRAAAALSHGGRFDADPCKTPLASAHAGAVFGPRFLVEAGEALSQLLAELD
jgi:aminoglycoside phosphotransferase (APT) family kinase protein